MHVFNTLALTQDEVFKSINDNVGSPADPSKLIPWICGAIAIAAGAFVYNKWQKRQITPRLLNSSAKLLREALKKVPIGKTPVKNLKLLAQQQGCSSPLTLLICPSLLAKAAAKKNKSAAGTMEIDRKALLELARQMAASTKPPAAS